MIASLLQVKALAMQRLKPMMCLAAVMLGLVGCNDAEENAESDASTESGGGSLFSFLPQQSTPSDQTDAPVAGTQSATPATGGQSVTPMPPVQSTPPGAPGQGGPPMTAAAPTETESTLPEPAEITVPMPADIPIYQGAVQIRGEATEEADMYAVFVCENVNDYDYQTVTWFYEYDNLTNHGWDIRSVLSGFGKPEATISANKPGYELEILIKPESNNRVSITMKLNER